jgi:hypothetical protein
MPLPSATSRKLIHTREIKCEGFLRDDGLWDIDSWLTDVKQVAYTNYDRGLVAPGEPIHAMGLRMTIDQSYVVQDIVAVTDFSPYKICPEVTPNFKRIIGLCLIKGFTRSVKELLSGVHGCTHLVDLLIPMATVALQTTRFGLANAQGERDLTVKPPFFDRCYTWASDSPVVKHEMPTFYTGK